MNLGANNSFERYSATSSRDKAPKSQCRSEAPDSNVRDTTSTSRLVYARGIQNTILTPKITFLEAHGTESCITILSAALSSSCSSMHDGKQLRMCRIHSNR